MLHNNVTTITKFIITGFPGLQPRFHGLVGVLLLSVYLIIVTGNALIVFIVAMERYLQKPPYLIFCNLAVSDIVIATAILPKLIALYWAGDNVIFFSSCFLQMFVVHLFQGFSSLFLVLMALDRYIAICNPLRYQALMKNSTLLTLIGLSSLISAIRMVTVLIQTVSLPYCKSSTLLHSYCSNTGLSMLACENGKEVQRSAFVSGMILLLGPLTFIIFSYISIIISIMKMTNVEGRHKMFATCSPQLFIICLYYIPRCFNHLATSFNFNLNRDIETIIVMLYSLLPPMVNPFIYFFRNREIKEVLIRQLKVKKIRRLGDHKKCKVIK